MTLVHDLLTLYIWILFLAALLSWFPARDNGGLATLQRTLARVTDPVLIPLRQILPRPRLGGVGVDFSVFVAIILLTIINRVI
ncbi:MAG: YggT family protein [Acidobacteriota bacterium]|nr:YggT family protein [Acidobacteriota bacterium]